MNTEINKKDPLIEILFQEGDPPFICGVNGMVTTGVLDKIESDVTENAVNYFDQGDGVYLFEASYFSGQYGEFGRCELAPCWELDLVLFTPNPWDDVDPEDFVDGVRTGELKIDN